LASNRLLVIDDDPASSAIIGRIARGCGYDTIITIDADDFRSRVISWEPTVIVLDLSMPDMDGDQVIAWLAKRNCKGHILIVSGLEMARLRKAEATGLSLGLNMAGVLQKSLHVEKIRDVLLEIYDAADVLSIQDISKALVNREIRLVYQPQIDLRSGTAVGFEALARWDHPKRGPVPPATFIPLLEANEIMNDFTSQILGMALDDMRLWNGATGARVSINASAANCGRMGIDKMVRSQCIDKGIDIQRITIEITERAAMTEASQVDDCLARLYEMGARVSIDDFGTGYSSLSRLHQLPFSELKIDRSFITDNDSDLKNGILARAMIDLAHNLNKKVVAEGVESVETLHWLRELGCDFAQGYFIGRPMPPDEVVPWLRQYVPPVGISKPRTAD
jgi:EAL domain-containing protein (putative c-di-GMP-specific phosphodiesterase class I)